MTSADFLSGVRRIAASDPTYRTGGDGSDGTCDCVGLIMGALGGEFPMHSSNWFARYRTEWLEELSGAAQLIPGMIVYKVKTEDDAGYDLHERYLSGGRYDTGDRLDYYHVGVVESVDPLNIVHCTSGGGADGIAYANTIHGWTHCGFVSSVEYSATQEDNTMDGYPYNARVVTQDGNPVKMRPSPSTSKPYIAKIPNGDSVTVQEAAQGWATVVWQGQRGYVMSQYLMAQNAENNPADSVADAGERVTITIDKAAAAALLEALGGVL